LDIYLGDVVPGKNVLIVGGGLVGCEFGLHLAKTGHQITIIEVLDKLAIEAFGMYREALTREMDKCGIVGYTETNCLEITENSVRVAVKDGAERVFETDTVIYALGMAPNNTEELSLAAGKIPVFTVGDCVRPAKVDSAVREGYLAAMEII
jgi:pyruvate/2-oxoglutarate dehydrogenase complex dihydrolipoamide dehydrogenase (E3) component